MIKTWKFVALWVEGKMRKNRQQVEKHPISGRKAIIEIVEYCIDLIRRWEETGILADMLYCVLEVIADVIGH